MTDTGDGGLASGRVAVVPARKAVLYCLAVVSVAAAVIHFAVAGSHFQEYWVFGVIMLVVAWLQLAWAIGAVARPGRPLLWVGAVVNAGVIVVYIVTRTAGDIIGPTPHAVEPFGFGDGLCTVLEAIIVAGCCLLLAVRFDRQIRRHDLVAASIATSGATAVLLSVALVAGGPEMVMTMGSASATTTHVSPRPRVTGRSRRPARQSSTTSTSPITCTHCSADPCWIPPSRSRWSTPTPREVLC
jgi:hypothetical protein